MELKTLQIPDYQTTVGKKQDLELSYQTFGQPLGKAPIVLVNHALTGNSNVAGENGWWSDLIGEGRSIDTRKYSVLAFNIPGNGFDGFIIENYKDFVAADVAQIFLLGLEKLGIEKLYAIIGGSLGGGIAWEMATLDPKITEHLIPVASDWKSTDWLIANCQIQDQILNNSSQPVHDARMHAMLCYRTPESFNDRFKRSTNEELQIFNVESWLMHHGKKLKDRFQLSAYKLMNQLLKTIDITRNGKKGLELIQNSDIKIHIVGVNSDLFFTAKENQETYKRLAQAHSNVTYGEVQSLHGHDAFLMEYRQLEKLLDPVFPNPQANKPYKILKFGGKSLANDGPIEKVLDIISDHQNEYGKIAVVASARGKTTDILEELLELATQGPIDKTVLDDLVETQTMGHNIPEIVRLCESLQKKFEGIALIGSYSSKTKDEVLATGELMSCHLITFLLNEKGIKAKLFDTRELFVTNNDFGNAQLQSGPSKLKTLQRFSSLAQHEVPVFPGFFGSNETGETTTLGRNGSNYTAALIANFLDAKILLNYTHVDGIYSADPNLVTEAKVIDQLSFAEANELAFFGTQILHAKTIIPLLEKNIPLRILNTFNPESKGTLVSATTQEGGVKSISVIEDVSLIYLEGRGLLGKVGIDARVFGSLQRKDVNVGIISQGSSERGIGFVVKSNQAAIAKAALEEEFRIDFSSKDVSSIDTIEEVAVVSVIGEDLHSFHRHYSSLTKNRITPILFNNSISGKNVSLVLKKEDLHKAVHSIHGQLFGVDKKINVAIFGVGTVGGTLVDQIVESKEDIKLRQNIDLRIFALANSRQVLYPKNGQIGKKWRNTLKTKGVPYKLQDITRFANDNHLENLILIDNTASPTFVDNYGHFVNSGFDLVSSNKIANTLPIQKYQELRELLSANNRKYLYETNVGAGLPLIDTIKLLHLSGENITRIRGVFSGSLSYIFNNFSCGDKKFSEILQEAVDKGFTEPDPREDLSGNDVGRKLLILARELDLINEFEDIEIENLITADLQDIGKEEFLDQLHVLDEKFEKIRSDQKEGYVLRYIGDLYGDLHQEKGLLDVNLVSVPKSSSLGQVSGSDSIIEIYTESYGDQPLVIQGAGAGAAVTARGVFGDILRIAQQN